eukprot:TRINITY_DN185_c0_g2_i1.p1 TRINITY_DN185_c0_g2~~TRINITY_DN185_c0_g2_i1.p1  ORF type:complete len:484 (-),score=43.08 TRINITY_DN185_c0_g2_i1:105-1556(-)
MIKAGKYYMERFLRPGLTQLDPRLTDIRVSYLDRVAIASDFLEQGVDDPLMVYYLIVQIRRTSAVADKVSFEKFIELALDTNLLLRLKPFLDLRDPVLLSETVWIYTNIAASSSCGCSELSEHGIIQKIIDLFPASDIETKINCVWAIANYAADNEKTRAHVMKSRFITDFIQLLKAKNLPYSLLRNCCWTINNLFRKKSEKLSVNDERTLIDFLIRNIGINDLESQSSVLFTLSRFTEGAQETVQYITKNLDYSLLFSLLDPNQMSICVPAMRIIGNVTSGDDSDVDMLIAAGVLPPYINLLMNGRKSTLLRETAWGLSNIAAGTLVQKQKLVEAGIVGAIHTCLEKSKTDIAVLKELAFVISNLFSMANEELVEKLIKEGSIEIMKEFMRIEDAKILAVILEGFDEMLKQGKKIVDEVEKSGCLALFEKCQIHPDQRVYELAYKILDRYFEKEDEFENIINNALSNTIEAQIQFIVIRCFP